MKFHIMWLCDYVMTILASWDEGTSVIESRKRATTVGNSALYITCALFYTMSQKNILGQSRRNAKRIDFKPEGKKVLCHKKKLIPFLLFYLYQSPCLPFLPNLKKNNHNVYFHCCLWNFLASIYKFTRKAYY